MTDEPCTFRWRISSPVYLLVANSKLKFTPQGKPILINDQPLTFRPNILLKMYVYILFNPIPSGAEFLKDPFAWFRGAGRQAVSRKYQDKH